MTIISSYPALQESFLSALYFNKREKFEKDFMETMTYEANSRKERIRRSSIKDPFFLDFTTPLKDLFIYQKALNDLFSLSWDDELLIEKSYYLLDEIISYAKDEGQKAIISYVSSNELLMKEIKEKCLIDWEVITQTHLSHDLEMTKFETNLLSVKKYCQYYRKGCYDLVKEPSSCDREEIMDDYFEILQNF